MCFMYRLYKEVKVAMRFDKYHSNRTELCNQLLRAKPTGVVGTSIGKSLQVVIAVMMCTTSDVIQL